MSNKYYRGLIRSVDNVKNKLQLALMTLKINENRNIISGIKNDISGINDFSDKINDNETNITNNLTKINTNKSDIDEINSNLSDKYVLENFFINYIEIENNYNLNKDNRSYLIFKYTLEDDFKKDSILETDCRLLYRYNNYNHIGYVHHIFKLYDNNDNMIYEYKSLITNAGDNTRNDIKQNDFFYVKINNDYKIIKIELILSLIVNVSNTTSVNCRLYNTFKSNFLVIKFYKKINLISVKN